MKILLLASVLVFSCYIADATELTGSWRLKYAELAGQKHNVKKGVDMTLKINGTTWTETSTATVANNRGYRARFTTDDSKRPRQLDIFVTSGTPGTVWKGIYEIVGNTLKVCRTRVASRPTTFSSSTDGKVKLFVYERIGS